MARRKQQNPKHLETSQELAMTLQNGITASSDNEDDEHVCGKCRAEFLSLSDFLKHKMTCVSKRPVLVCSGDVASSRDALEPTTLSDDDRLPPTLTAMIDATPAFYNGDYLNRCNQMPQFHALPQIVQRMSATNVTIAELRNTTVAVSQQGRNLPRSQLAAILTELRRQQAAQMNAIEMLSAEILGEPISPTSIPLVGTAALTPPQSGSEGAVGGATPTNNHHPSAPVAARTCASDENAPLLTENGANTAYEPNTLELLQRHTEKALQQTMTSGTFYLSSMGLKRVKDGKQPEECSTSQRHRCRFCGKHFGSDSALQIHLRSHTGERPFKCNVCGSCFSTRGNLKVHFQRHKERLEVPTELMMLMNGDLSNPAYSSNGEAANGTINIVGDGLDQSDQALDFSTNAEPNKSPTPNINSDQMGNSCRSRSVTPNEMSALSDDSGDISVDGADDQDDINLRNDDFDDDDASNLSTANDMDIDSDNQLHSSPFTSPSFGSIFRPSSFSNSVLSDTSPVLVPPRTSSSSTAAANDPNVALHQDPSLYQDLLPRIGSNDNSWESLMEVTETSETTKLQKLVDNIEVADPNQCIICHRVLSCRSALQMHYRTHTGERPFKCKICGRAFTTKGNLKTHMGVHRHKPPSRVLHQCPVCHKQFANSIILQQHVRMHTTVASPALTDSLYFGENKNNPTLLPPSYPRPMVVTQQVSNLEPLALTSSDQSRYQSDNLKSSDSVIKIAAKSDTSHHQSSSCASSPAGSSTSSGDGPNSGAAQADDCSAAEDVDAKSDEATKALEGEVSKRLPVTRVDDVSPVSSIAQGDHNTPPDEKKNSFTDLTNNESAISRNLTRTEPTIAPSPRKSLSPQPNGGRESSPLQLSKPESSKPQPTVLNLPNDKPLPMNLPSNCPISLSLQSNRQQQLHHTLSIPPHTQSDFTTSLTALENQVKAINSSTTSPLPFPAPYGLGFGMPTYYRHDFGFSAYASSGKDKLGRSFSPSSNSLKNVSADSSADDRSTPGSTIKSNDSPKTSSVRSDSGALDLTPRGSSSSSTTISNNMQQHHQRSAATADLKVFTPLAGLPFPPSPHSRMGTTCQLCFKTFACQSALEIHYRSHTKERPFKCDVCDRGFSTKGNMKQHMLTHKIRDLPPQLFTSSSTTTTSSPTTLPPTTAGANTTNNPAATPTKKYEEPTKRPSSDSSHSPKRPPGIPKHVCEVCRKPFSSGSALQIHMRTHTGVKPFQCNICSRAFTTKGNLKVHMGTHLSSSGTSRRGRRMSLDISPLNLPLGKPGEYPRPDMFFPYLPPFMKSVLPPPKMNEISVIQSAGNREDITGGNTSLASLISAAAHQQSPFGPAPPNRSSIGQQQHKPEDKPDEGGHRSPIRSRERGSSTSPSNGNAPQDLQQVSATADRNAVAAAASWGWKIACNRCNKICSSSTELELHISSEHMKSESSVENLSATT